MACEEPHAEHGPGSSPQLSVVPNHQKVRAAASRLDAGPRAGDLSLTGHGGAARGHRALPHADPRPGQPSSPTMPAPPGHRCAVSELHVPSGALMPLSGVVETSCTDSLLSHPWLARCPPSLRTSVGWPRTRWTCAAKSAGPVVLRHSRDALSLPRRPSILVGRRLLRLTAIHPVFQDRNGRAGPSVHRPPIRSEGQV